MKFLKIEIQVSAIKSGFLPLSQESCLIGEVSYHDYFGILVDPEERELIARNLGPVNKVNNKALSLLFLIEFISAQLIIAIIELIMKLINSFLLN